MEVLESYPIVITIYEYSYYYKRGNNYNRGSNYYYRYGNYYLDLYIIRIIL